MLEAHSQSQLSTGSAEPQQKVAARRIQNVAREDRPKSRQLRSSSFEIQQRPGRHVLQEQQQQQHVLDNGENEGKVGGGESDDHISSFGLSAVFRGPSLRSRSAARPFKTKN